MNTLLKKTTQDTQGKFDIKAPHTAKWLISYIDKWGDFTLVHTFHKACNRRNILIHQNSHDQFHMPPPWTPHHKSRLKEYKDIAGELQCIKLDDWIDSETNETSHRLLYLPCWTRNWQGWHGPEWHTWAQECCEQFRRAPQTSSQSKGPAWLQRTCLLHRQENAVVLPAYIRVNYCNHS